MNQQIRTDPFVGRQVIYAPDRSLRPSDYAGSLAGNLCPFCAGNEHLTPEASLQIPEADMRACIVPLWQVRVVPNRYPALCSSTEPGVLAKPSELGSYPELPEIGGAAVRPGIGCHEVVIESPLHVERTTQLETEQLARVLWAYRERIAAHRRDGRWAFASIFQNVGLGAGASLSHLHSQVLAMPFVPAQVAEELAQAAAFTKAQGGCLYCGWLAKEIASERLVTVEDGWAVLCPATGKMAYETWLLPVVHQPDFDALTPEQVTHLAKVLHGTLKKMDRLLENPPYNCAVCTAPYDLAHPNAWHWRLVIMPRMHGIAGFELATGCHLNPVLPETAARQLRDI